jgi:hypothetical protein
VNTSDVLMTAMNLRSVYVDSTAGLRASIASDVRRITDASFPVDRADDAFAHLRSGAHRGKIAIHIAHRFGLGAAASTRSPMQVSSI